MMMNRCTAEGLAGERKISAKTDELKTRGGTGLQKL